MPTNDLNVLAKRLDSSCEQPYKTVISASGGTIMNVHTANPNRRNCIKITLFREVAEAQTTHSTS
jgi:hypothetical protein